MVLKSVVFRCKILVRAIFGLFFLVGTLTIHVKYSHCEAGLKLQYYIAVKYFHRSLECKLLLFKFQTSAVILDITGEKTVNLFH